MNGYQAGEDLVLFTTQSVATQASVIIEEAFEPVDSQAHGAYATGYDPLLVGEHIGIVAPQTIVG